MDPLMFLVDLGVLYSVYVILASSLNLEYGELGLPNFAKSAFFAVGAFSVGALSVRLGTLLLGITMEGEFKLKSVYYATLVSQALVNSPQLGVILFVVPLMIAVPLAALLGVLASYPALRLREDYLGMLLIAFSEIIRVVARNYEPLVGGTYGAGVVDFLAWIPPPLKQVVLLALSSSIAFAIWLAYYRLSRSPFGRVLRAIRDNELAASVLGRDVAKMRMTVMALGSGMAAVAGVLYAFYVGSVNPDDFTISKTFLVALMVIIGGRGNPYGALVGPATYIAVDRSIQFAKQYLALPFDPNYASYVILGVALILIVMKKPEGIAPEKPAITLPSTLRRALSPRHTVPKPD